MPSHHRRRPARASALATLWVLGTSPRRPVGPLVLTAPTELAAATASELVTLQPAAITLLGGTAAISRDVEVRLAGFLP